MAEPSGRKALSPPHSAELSRIRREYTRREREIPADFYSLERPVNLYFWQSRLRSATEMLRAERFLPLTTKRILEVGCGAGGWLPDFERLGADRRNLAGIDLDEGRIREAAGRLGARLDGESGRLEPAADLQCGDASDLPWPSSSFDLVVQSTVFSSILDDRLQEAIAREMQRVLRPAGAILWFDFAWDNPWNDQVRGVPSRRIAQLFPNSRMRTRRTLVAPPIARAVAAHSTLLLETLERFRLLNTHLLALLSTNQSSASGRAIEC